MTALATDTQGPGNDVSPTPEKKKRQRRGRKPGVTVELVGAQPTKTLLLDELGDALIDQLDATIKLNDRLDVPKVSVVDHLRSDFTTNLIATSCASTRSSSSRTLTGVESTPPTSLDDRASSKTPVTSSTTLANQSRPSNDSLRTLPAADQQGGVFRLDDFSAMAAIQRLTAQYGRVAHMGILDRSYRFFVNTMRTAALSFKVQNGVAIVGGDPLCENDMVAGLLAEFSVYRRKHRWDIAFMGASESFVRDFAQPRGWTTIRFGTERVLNPQTNEVLLERGGKRIAVQNRQLLHPHKGGVTLGVYAPIVHGTDTQLQADLVAIYDAWRAERNNSSGPQAFITVYDPFALPELMTFVFSRGPDGRSNGFAALRRLGSGGYHVDPCIAAPNSPKGISDLLIVAAMSLLQRVGVSYLGFGFEPCHALSPEDITGMPGPVAALTKALYGHTFQRLPIRGKKTYHDKFRPDASQDCGLYLVFHRAVPGPRHMLGMVHVANISLRKILWADMRAWASKRKVKSSSEGPPGVRDNDATARTG